MIEQLNLFFQEHLNMHFLGIEAMMSTLVTLAINSITIGIIIRCFYVPRSNQRSYATVLATMATCIFLLVSLMNSSSSLDMGAAMGLFAIFSIMRFRTEAIPVREMMYQFTLIAISVVNAMGGATYHFKRDAWEGLGFFGIVVINIIFIVLIWLTETSFFAKERCSKYIKYDNISLIAPEKRAELIADIEKRTGLKIQRIEVGMVDFLKDSCLIRIFYNEPMDEGSSIAKMARPPRG